MGVVILHIIALHTHGSNNPLGIDRSGPQDSISFHPYYTIKDLFGLSFVLTIFFLVVFYAPNFLGHPDNYIPADPLKTPAHIVPEWYFLPFYAILRAIPDKLGGVIAMISAIMILFFLPWLDTSKVRSATFRPIYKKIYWLLIVDLIILTWVGGNAPEGKFIIIGRIATIYYFVHILLLMPIVGLIEKPRKLPSSISENIFKKSNEKEA